MPKMSRADFVETVESVWGRALDNFVRDDHLAPALIGYDPMGRETMFLMGSSVTAEMSPAEVAEVEASEEQARRAGIIPVRGRWQENLDALRATMRERRCVAAVCLGEAWVVKNEAAVDAAQSGVRASEHPENVEILYLNAMWPREYVSTLHLREVSRDDSGVRHLARADDPLPDGASIAAWMEEILPAAHR